MARLSSSAALNLTLVLTNYRVVVVRFPELAVVAGLIGLLATEGKITEMVAMMIVVVEIAALRLDLAGSSRIVAARSSGEIDSALRMRCSSELSLTEFLRFSSWFLGTLQCCVLFHGTDNKSTGLLGYDS
jgi:hypothetical protein